MAERRSPKSKAAGSNPSSPAIIAALKQVKTAADISDEYIKANFDLSQERLKTKKTVDVVPLISTFIDYITNLHSIERGTDPLQVGVNITPELLSDAMHAVFPPNKTLFLFKAKLFRYEEIFDIGKEHISGSEIVLYKEQTVYEKTEHLMHRLKIRVYGELIAARKLVELRKKKKAKLK